MKTCSRCRKTKPLDAFTRSARASDGRQSWCKACKNEDAKARHAANPEPGRQRARLNMRRRRREQPEAERAYIETWRAENADRERARDAARRQTPERRAWTAAYWREWKRRNPKKTREIARRGQLARRARLADAFVEDVDPLVVLDTHDGICGICGEPVDPANFHVDHIIPLSRGGEHSYANTQPAHPPCNVRKHDRLPEEMAA